MKSMFMPGKAASISGHNLPQARLGAFNHQNTGIINLFEANNQFREGGESGTIIDQALSGGDEMSGVSI